MLEMAAALVAVGWLVGTAALIPAVAVAAVLVVLALVRRRGHSLPEWLGSLLALRARMRRAASTPAPSGIDSGLAPAVECDPSLRTYSFHRGDRRDQRPVGMVGDGGFLTAVLQLESDAGALRAERSRRPLPVALVQDVLEVDGIRLESAQILVHTQPAARAASAPAVGRREQLRTAPGPDRRSGGAHHVDSVETRPRVVPRGGGRARRRAPWGAEVSGAVGGALVQSTDRRRPSGPIC